jgi:hypothetical protein
MIPGASRALPSLRRSRDNGSPRGRFSIPGSFKLTRTPSANHALAAVLRNVQLFPLQTLTSLEQRTNAQDERCQIHNYPLSKKSKRP